MKRAVLQFLVVAVLVFADRAWADDCSSCEAPMICVQTRGGDRCVAPPGQVCVPTNSGGSCRKP